MSDGIHGKCFACNFYGDIFDYVAARDHISLQDATRALIERYQPGAARPSQDGGPKLYRPNQTPAASQPIPARSFADYAARAHAALKGSPGETYLTARGITAATMDRFQLGYDPGHYFPSARDKHPAIVFPYDRSGHYVAWRSIIEKHFDKPKKDEAGEEPVFNAAALYQGEPVFVVESQIDAITICQEGGQAVAIGGGGLRKLERQIEARAPRASLILCFDNDAAGERDYEAAAAMLTEMGIPHIKANVSGAAKDPNDLLQQSGPQALQENIQAALDAMAAAGKRAAEDQRQQREKASAAGYMETFLDDLYTNRSTRAISTGFPALDELFDGGLYTGLYTLGAITSLGKTAFCLQLCDQIAASGHDVLYFSMEMSRQELMARSISRTTFRRAKREGIPTKRAKSTRGIMASQKWENYSREELELIAAAVDEYKATAGPHVWHYEGLTDMNVIQLRQEVEKHIAITGNIPVVFVDYLQIMEPLDTRASDKQNTDKAVKLLKILSRDTGAAVVCISSLNRDNYTEPINNAAYKESGAIEYTSDVLMGLQFMGMDYQAGEKAAAREVRIRTLINSQLNKGNDGGAEFLQLKILKNRNGKRGMDLGLFYWPVFNAYEEAGTGAAGFTPAGDQGNPFDHRRGRDNEQHA